MSDLRARLQKLIAARPGITQAEAACELLVSWKAVAAVWPEQAEAAGPGASAGCGEGRPAPGTVTPTRPAAPQPAYTYRSRPIAPMPRKPREYRKPRGKVEHTPGCW